MRKHATVPFSFSPQIVICCDASVPQNAKGRTWVTFIHRFRGKEKRIRHGGSCNRFRWIERPRCVLWTSLYTNGSQCTARDAGHWRAAEKRYGAHVDLRPMDRRNHVRYGKARADLCNPRFYYSAVTKYE
jgi:hypothetical protein